MGFYLGTIWLTVIGLDCILNRLWRYYSTVLWTFFFCKRKVGKRLFATPSSSGRYDTPEGGSTAGEEGGSLDYRRQRFRRSCPLFPHHCGTHPCECFSQGSLRTDASEICLKLHGDRRDVQFFWGYDTFVESSERSSTLTFGKEVVKKRKQI